MKKPAIILSIIIALTAVIVLSCRPSRQHRGITDENQRTHVDSVIFAVFDTRDVPRTLAVIDSLEQTGELSTPRSIFYRTITYNLRGEYRKSLNYYYQLADIDVNSKKDLEGKGMTVIEYPDSFFDDVLAIGAVNELYQKIDGETNGLGSVLQKELAE